jgi:hypothetical protein
MSKTYTVSITFEYDGDEGAPLTGKPINHADDAIQAVRDELEAQSPYDFIIDCKVYEDGELSHGITG